MISLDTNVLARAIAAEIDADATTTAQRKRAQALLSSGRQFFVPITVILELEWVLRGAYGMPSDEIAALFEDMIKVENLTIDEGKGKGDATLIFSKCKKWCLALVCIEIINNT